MESTNTKYRQNSWREYNFCTLQQNNSEDIVTHSTIRNIMIKKSIKVILDQNLVSPLTLKLKS